jgi:predicted RND superfamily exporter protein
VFRRLIGLVIRFRLMVLIVMILLTGFFATQTLHMQMFTQFLDLFPSTHPYVQIHKFYAKYYGGAYQATLMIELKEGGKYKDVFNLETLNKMQQIQYDVDLIPGVDHFAIYSIASPKVSFVRETPDGFSSRPMMKEVPKDEQELNDLKKRVFTSQVYGTLVSVDQKALLLNANFIEERIDFNKLFEAFMKIKQREEDANHKIYLTGMPLVYGWIYHYVPEMAVIFLITALVIVGLSFLYMGRGGLWFFPFLGAILCSVWGLGLSALLGYHFDPLIVVIPFLLSARAMSHGVQWVERFGEEYRRLGDTKEASLVTGAGLFPPGLISILTDALGLTVISITPIPILKNLAYLGTFWAVSAIFVVLLFFPALFSMFKKVKVPEVSDKPTTIGYKIEFLIEHYLRRILGRISGWTFGNGRYITVGSAVAVLIVAVISSTYLKYGDANPGTPILWPDSEYNLDVKRTNDFFPGVDQMWVVIEGKNLGDITKPDVVKGMEALKQYMMEDPNVGFVTSVADLIKGVNMLACGNDPKRESIPTADYAVSQLLQLYGGSTAPGEMDQWVDPRASSTNVRLFLKNHQGDLLEEVINRVRDFIKNNPNLMENAVAKPAGGLGGILAAANEVIAIKNHQILFMVLGMTFILCTVTYRSVLAGILFTMSLVLANFLAFTYMVFKGVGLNINTLPVASLGIGLGVDYGLYIVSRIMEVYQEEKDLRKAVIGGVTTSGKAVFFTATMMTAGVIFWYFSPLRFQAEMGFLLGVLMMVNMLVGVIVLPAVINILKPKFIFKPPIA